MLKSLSVSLIYAAGPHPKPRPLHLAIHATGALFLSGAMARGTVALRDRGFSDFELSAAEFDALCRAAAAAGFGERIPCVEARFDTGQHGATVLLRVAHERGEFTLSLGLMCSSYEGPDAPGLRSFLSLLLSAAGVCDESILHDLVGPS